MDLIYSPNSLAKFKSYPGRREKSFEIPDKNRDLFTKTIIAAIPDITGASLIIDQTVFYPRKLWALLGIDHPESVDLGYEATIVAVTAQEAGQLLQAILFDGVEGLFVPVPRRFVIYADHHGYCTFYADKLSDFESICAALIKAGFQTIKDYRRSF